MPTIRQITLPDGVTYDLASVQSDWAQTDSTAGDYIKNKPHIEVTPRLGGTAATNFIKIKINSTETWMLSFVVTIYQGYRATKYMISGYNYASTGKWYGASAVIISDSETAGVSMAVDKTVTFGYDDVNELWVAFDGGDYTGVSIDVVTNGYTQVLDDINDLFEISFPSSLSGTTQSTVVPQRPLFPYDTASAATANTLVLRNNAGDTFARYYNTSISDQNPASYTSSVAFIDSNGYLRKSSKANFNAWAKDSSGNKTLNATYGAYYERVNGMCTVRVDYRSNVTSTISVGTLPSGYRPPWQVMAANATGGANSAYLIVNTNGAVQLAKVGSGGWCIATVTYPAAA